MYEYMRLHVHESVKERERDTYRQREIERHLMSMHCVLIFVTVVWDGPLTQNFLFTIILKFSFVLTQPRWWLNMAYGVFCASVARHHDFTDHCVLLKPCSVLSLYVNTQNLWLLFFLVNMQQSEYGYGGMFRTSNHSTNFFRHSKDRKISTPSSKWTFKKKKKNRSIWLGTTVYLLDFESPLAIYIALTLFPFSGCTFSLLKSWQQVPLS